MHNPVQPASSANGRKSQYRSAIFCDSKEHLALARASKDRLESELRAKGLLGLSISTEITLLEKFWRAEEYHQKYYAKKMGKHACRL